MFQHIPGVSGGDCPVSKGEAFAQMSSGQAFEYVDQKIKQAWNCWGKCLQMFDSLRFCTFLRVNGQVPEEAKPRQAASLVKFDKQDENKGSPMRLISFSRGQNNCVRCEVFRPLRQAFPFRR